MATLTGGRAMVLVHSVAVFLETTGESRSSLYSLGFEPASRTGFHTLAVKGKRGLTLRHRQSYLAKTPQDLLADRVLGALTLGWEENPHRLDLNLYSEIAGEDGIFDVSVLLTVPIGGLALAETDGIHRADCRVAVVAMDPQGQVLRPQFMEIPLQIPSDDLDAARTQVFGARLELRLPPGRQKVAIGLWDAQANRGSFVTGDVTIGDG